MSQQRLGRWATEAKAYLLKYRPKMAAELERQGKQDDWARKAADRAVGPNSERMTGYSSHPSKR